MKTNLKALELIEKGLSSKIVGKLTESQINVLHKKLLGEAVTQSTTTSYNIPTADLDKGTAVPTPPAGKKMVLQKTNTGVKATPTTEEVKESDKENKNNPWAICRKQLGPKKNAKFESCVKQVKKSLKEGKNPISLFIENKIMELVETHLPPRITKQDLVKYLSEQNPATAPVKEPKTKPGTKEPPSPVKTPSHPGKNPNPGVKEAPKANIDPEEAKEKIIDVILKMLKK
jgi:hypothetical protein